jgi:hypothetical protein
MNRSVTNFILALSLIVLAALVGLLGYRAFQKAGMMMVKPVSTISAPVFSAGPDLVITDHLRSTSTGIVADIRLTNKSTEDFTGLTITALKFDSFSAKPLPIVEAGLKVGRSVTVTVSVPGLKTLTPAYKSYDYRYDWASGGGSGTFSTGMPPAVSPSKPAKYTASKGIRV